MTLRPEVRTRVQLPCRVCWGTDPRIVLRGIVVEIGIETMLITLNSEDRPLWPVEGRRVQIQVIWTGTQKTVQTHPKLLDCRSTVTKRTEYLDGSARLICNIRKGRFVDAGAAEQPGILHMGNSKWKM